MNFLLAIIELSSLGVTVTAEAYERISIENRCF